MLTLTEKAEMFEEYLRATKARRTRHNYMCRVRTYLRTLASDDDFTTLHVRAYKDALGETLRPRAVESHRSALNAFGEWLVAEGHLTSNPVAPIKAIKLDKPVRPTPKYEQVNTLFDALPRLYHPYRIALARAVLSVFAYSGVRRSELLALRLADLDLPHGELHVRHGKGDKPRAVPLSPKCITALEEYVRLRPECEVESLFLLRQGQALADEGLRELLRKCFAVADLKEEWQWKPLLPHSLRHYFATTLDRSKEWSLPEIGAVLGHSSPVTTAGYVEADEIDNLKAKIHLAEGRPGPPPAAPSPAPNASPSPAETPALPSWLRIVEGGGESA